MICDPYSASDAELFLDISPNTAATSRSEPCEAKNSLVLQIRSTSDQDLLLYNEESRTDYGFLPLNQAVPVPGLTMIYFVFTLGEGEGCLTTTGYFKKIRLSCPEDFAVKRVGDDTLVFFPLRTMEFSSCDIAELSLLDLVTDLPAGTSTLCKATVFTGGGRYTLNSCPVHVVRHPLQIPIFQVAPGYGCAAFGDTVQFLYRVMGADSCVFTPGDVSMEKNGSILAVGNHESVLYRKTLFTLVASQGEQKISRSCQMIPLPAEIPSFSAVTSPSEKMKGAQKVTFKFTVKNTRHVYLSQAGRIEVESGTEQTVVIDPAQTGMSYTLSVENEKGLTWKTYDVN